MKDEYAEWAQTYDKFGSMAEIYESEKQFLKKMIAKYSIKSALDCACGTGPHLYFLAEQGINACGSDYSEAMLTVCKKNLSRYGVDIRLKAADFRYLESAWSESFDAVFCMRQSIAHLHTQEDIITAFKSMRSRLNERGILVMTQGTTHITLQDRFRFELVENNKNFSRVSVRDVCDGFQTYNYLDIYHNNKQDDMIIYSVHLKIILDDDYRRLLSEAGFSNIHIFGGFDMKAYDKEKSWRLIVVAEK
ncbi:MAG: class I SAM-dependent methyltransferase [Syntrophomonadaceae bacterium]|nr:class I SAM-dependent methyltransferase [Syntrophomonadaceae bacterium]